MQGHVTYNGHAFNEFFVPRTAAYVDQTDNHTAQLTVRETFDFATRVQGVGAKASASLAPDVYIALMTCMPSTEPRLKSLPSSKSIRAM